MLCTFPTIAQKCGDLSDFASGCGGGDIVHCIRMAVGMGRVLTEQLAFLEVLEYLDSFSVLAEAICLLQ
jgi:hypothetical protein